MWFFYNINFQNEHLDFFIDKIKSFFTKTFNEESYDETINSNFFIQLKKTNLVKYYLKDFYNNYTLLNEQQKSIIKKAFEINTDIEIICYSQLKPIKYSEVHESVRGDLKNIFNYLYKDLPKVKYFKETLGSFKNYYNQFYEHNFSNYTQCPFCGLKQMKTPTETRREPFDHYLLQSNYPFVSLIRNNLVPMCHDCNEDYKRNKDISLSKVFYPFTEEVSDVELEIRGGEVKLNSSKFPEEVESWDNIFEIKKRLSGHIERNKEGILANFTELELFGDEKLEEHVTCKINFLNKQLYFSNNFIEKAILLDEYDYVFKKIDSSAYPKETRKVDLINIK
ncbi:hypothetical protein [Lysinibacillus xylanilyticus]|uniref:HNH endonuclease n=1 Tax=Lysinibacillus xylanilyticus TaxID=582475 RepID=A0ABT4ENB1_9BACI|nr:hypothetical protein [Lysinibacillus xylanilyticus]MCY9547028.1 hypothetical protein [Lysinibacillus xylanilyticus]